MKISRIPNFGSFGVYIDDVNMDHMTDDEWHEIGKIFVKELLVIFRNITIDKSQYFEWIPKFGPLQSIVRGYLFDKYGDQFDFRDPSTWNVLDEDDLLYVQGRLKKVEEGANGLRIERIYGHVDEKGDLLGQFGNGEVNWHSNEGSSLIFAPSVALLGWEHMQGSATGFVQTIDLYEGFSQSFRSELDEMVLVHEFEAGRINDLELTNKSMAATIKLTFCPVDGAETPLVCTAPNGRKGLHYITNTRSYIKGMSSEATQSLFDYLDKLVFDQKHIHDHWYVDTRRDLLLFDNSVTLHKRTSNHPDYLNSNHPDRLAYRAQFTVGPLLDSPWLPWQHMPKYDRLYRQEIHHLVDIVGGELGKRLTLPELI